MSNAESDLDDVVGGSTINPVARNLLGQISDLLEDAKGEHHLDLAIPGTNDLLWVRYRRFPVAKTESKTEAMRRQIEKKRPVMLASACDTLIDACEQLFVLPPQYDGEIGDDGCNLIPIDDTIPVQFEKRLTDLFLKDKDIASQLKTARDVVLAMFPTEQSIIAQNVEVSQWLQGINNNIASDLVGE